jgi:ribonuclease J
MSSRIIPGNEQSVSAVVNALVRRGVRTRFRTTDPRVHVSGHAHAGEQRRMLELVRPRFFVPLHGTLMHLERHAELARASGVEAALVVENGAIVEASASGLSIVDRAQTGRVHVDAGEEVAPDVLRDRARLAELGMAMAVVLLESGYVLRSVEVVTRGVVAEEREAEVVTDACDYLEDELREWLDRRERDRAEIDPREAEDHARRALSRYFRRTLGRRPLTYAVVVGL